MGDYFLTVSSSSDYDLMLISEPYSTISFGLRIATGCYYSSVFTACMTLLLNGWTGVIPLTMLIISCSSILSSYSLLA